MNPLVRLYRRQAKILAKRKTLPGNLPRALRVRIASEKARLRQAESIEKKKNVFDPTIKQLYIEARERERLGKPIILDFSSYSYKIFRTIATKKSQFAWIFAIKPTGGYALENEEMLARLRRMVEEKKSDSQRIARINRVLRDLKQSEIRLSKITSTVYRLTSGRDFWEREQSSEQFRHNTINFTQRLAGRMDTARNVLNSMKRPLVLKEAEKARLERQRVREEKRAVRVARRNALLGEN